MIGRLMYVLIKNCNKGWRYDESSCYFNVRVMLALFFSMNFIATLLLILQRDIALTLSLFGTQFPFFIKFIYPIVIFFLLTILFPKHRVLNHYFVPAEKEKYFLFGYMLYCIFSIGVVIFVAVYKF